MNHVTIVIEIADEDADPEDETGLTEEAFDALRACLAPVATSVIEIGSGDRRAF